MTCTQGSTGDESERSWPSSDGNRQAASSTAVQRAIALAPAVDPAFNRAIRAEDRFVVGADSDPDEPHPQAVAESFVAQPELGRRTSSHWN